MGSGRVLEMWDPGEYQKYGILANTGNVGSWQVLEMGLGEYRKGGIRASTGKVGSRRVLKMGNSGRVPEMWDPGEYRKCGIQASTGKVGSG